MHQQMHDLVHDKIAAVLQLGDPGNFAFYLLVVIQKIFQGLSRLE